jgi:hypothetical protein
MKECSIANPATCYDLDKTGIWGEAVRQRQPIMLNDTDVRQLQMLLDAVWECVERKRAEEGVRQALAEKETINDSGVF